MIDVDALSGKVALVTGASRRIGRATAIKLAEYGADIVLHARETRSELEEVADKIHQLGRRALVQLADITSESAVATMFQNIKQGYGRLDILVNNASVRQHVRFESMSLTEWHRILGVILDGTFLCSRAAIPFMISAGGGTIVNIGGVSAHIGVKERAHVSTGKAGLVGLTKALAAEYAGANIRVNCVSPGRIGGSRSASSGQSISDESGRPLLPRLGEVDEVAAVVTAMCLPISSYITGQTVHVNGGMYLP